MLTSEECDQGVTQTLRVHLVVMCSGLLTVPWLNVKAPLWKTHTKETCYIAPAKCQIKFKT